MARWDVPQRCGAVLLPPAVLVEPLWRWHVGLDLCWVGRDRVGAGAAGRAERPRCGGDGGDGAHSSSRAAVQALRVARCCAVAVTALSVLAVLWDSSVPFYRSSGHLHPLGSSPAVSAPAPTGAEGQSPTSRLRLNLLLFLLLNLHILLPMWDPQCSRPSPHTRERNIQPLPTPPGFRSGPRLLSPSSHRGYRAEPSLLPRPAVTCAWKALFHPWIAQRGCPSQAKPFLLLFPCTAVRMRTHSPFHTTVVFLEETSKLLAASEDWMHHAMQGNGGQEG